MLTHMIQDTAAGAVVAKAGGVALLGYGLFEGTNAPFVMQAIIFCGGVLWLFNQVQTARGKGKPHTAHIEREVEKLSALIQKISESGYKGRKELHNKNAKILGALQFLAGQMNATGNHQAAAHLRGIVDDATDDHMH
jgi:hypothetical protein